MFIQKKSLVISSKTKQKILNVTSDCKLYSRLFITCQAQEGNLRTFLLMKTILFQLLYQNMGN